MHVHSGPEEINKRIESAIDLRSGDKLRREHIKPFSLMFKDSSLEEKVAGVLDRFLFYFFFFLSPSSFLLLDEDFEKQNNKQFYYYYYYDFSYHE